MALSKLDIPAGDCTRCNQAVSIKNDANKKHDKGRWIYTEARSDRGLSLASKIHQMNVKREAQSLRYEKATG